MYVVWSVVGGSESRFGAWESGDQVAGAGLGSEVVLAVEFEKGMHQG